VPGVTVTNPDTFGINTSLSATNQVVNGHRSNQNNMTVDGVGNLDAGANGSLINNVSPDFLQEVKVQTSNFSAQYGRSTGAAFNIVTKNGTDKFHGGVFEYFRNDALDARNFFAPNQTEVRYNDFGWNLGGPIKKEKLFFFVGEEWKRLRQQSAPTRVTLPTLAELQGNFAGTGHTINMPGTKTPFPNNVIPSSMLTPDGIAIANVYRTVIPLAAIYNNAAVSNNATFENPNPLDYREDIARLDYVINNNHRMFGRWVDDYNTIYLADGPGGSLPITPENRNRPGKSFLVSETWVVNPAIVETSETWEYEEGCLSVPGLYFPIVRPRCVTLSGYDLNGKEFVREGQDLLGRIFLHETDHLDGYLLIDRLEAGLRREAMKILRSGGTGGQVRRLGVREDGGDSGPPPRPE